MVNRKTKNLEKTFSSPFFFYVKPLNKSLADFTYFDLDLDFYTMDFIQPQYITKTCFKIKILACLARKELANARSLSAQRTYTFNHAKQAMTLVQDREEPDNL